MTSVVTEGASVVIQKLNGDQVRVVKVERHKSVTVDRLHFSLDRAIGAPLGALYEVTG